MGQASSVPPARRPNAKTPSSVLFDPDARQYPVALFPAEKSRREGRKIEQRQEQISSIY